MKENVLIVLASDHNGVILKGKIKAFLKENNYSCMDLGPYQDKVSVDYVDFAQQLGQIISNQDANLGILICGTGIGMSIAVNRFDNVRAALVHNLFSATKSREHNDANVLCLGAWLNNDELNIELLRTWLEEKFGEYRHVRRIEKINTNRSHKIIFTNGIFDILHHGHVNLLKFSKSLGEKLIVGINSDACTKRLKGPERPVNKQEDRKAVLQAIQYVDEVIIFEEDKPTALIEKLQPDIMVKGGEWTADEVRKRDNIPTNIEVKIFPLLTGYSTTNVIKTIREEEYAGKPS